MKQPKKGIRTTTRKTPPIIPPIAQIANPEVLPIFDKTPPYPGLAYIATNSPAMIENNDELIANAFCFGAFAEKVTGVVYNDLTGNFPFMSVNGSVCFFLMYHYKTNSLLATLIANMDNKSILEAYKTNYKCWKKRDINQK